MTKIPHEFHRRDLEEEDIALNTPRLEKDFKNILDEKSIIIDVGANTGQFALEVINIVPIRTIYSFEPVNSAFLELELLSKKHQQIVPIKKAVSAKNGNSKFFVTESDVGSSLLPPIAGQKSKWLTLEREITVELIRLDTFINSLPVDGKTISLLKSDAQGCDLDVILSAGKYLNPRTIKSIIVEINFATFYEGQQNYHDIFSVLTEAGYRMAWFYPHRAHDEWLWWADVLFIEK
jgi:FkbM family methyltransferase